jgi:ACS family glucarate transporter-like MFS transporter
LKQGTDPASPAELVRPELSTSMPLAASGGPMRSVGFILILSCFSLVGYVLRMNISIAAAQMLPELHLTKVQLGKLLSGFLIGYTAFQIPWGVLGDRFGARYVLAAAALVWGVTSFFTGLVPGLLLQAGSASFVALYLLRLLLGMAEAAGFPVAARAVASHMPGSRHGLGYAAVVAGTAAGSSITPPLIAFLMTTRGWRASFYVTSLFAFALAAVWLVMTRPSIETPGPSPSSRAALDRASWKELLREPMIWLLSASYFFESYVLYVFVFWSYLYLVEQRHFTLLRGGFYTGLPFLAAFIAVPLVGYASDVITVRKGYRVGRRNAAIGLMALSAAFLFFAVQVENSQIAIGALSLSVASLLSVESIFWSSSIELGGRYAGTAGAIMNTAGNLGGIVSTLAVPLLIQRVGWTIAFGSTGLLAAISAVLWFKIGLRRLENSSGQEAV